MKRRVIPLSRTTSLAVMCGAYLWAIAVAFAIGSQLPVNSPLVKAGIVDLIATVMVFAMSVIFDNSSIYDPYWSVAPIVMTGYWVLQAPGGPVANPRGLIVLLLVAVWGVRLTANFLTHWKGMEQEDWRYLGFRERGAGSYWGVSFFGFHLVPTVIVFVGCVPVYLACTLRSPLGVIDVVAIVVTLAAIVIESVADAQMRAAAATGAYRETTFRGGLWAYSRHPNYFGEVLFWWGLYLFGLAADTHFWWTIFGPIGVTALFVLVSLPLIERRMIERRSDYAEIHAEVPMLVPRLRKRS